MKVLFTGCTFDDLTLKRLKNKNIIIDNGRTDYSEEELKNILANYDCYINGGDEICTKSVIEKNKHLKLISFMGTGYQKYIDVESAKTNNIPVSYTPSANAKSVAEYTVALILDGLKQITFTNNEVKKGMWNKHRTSNLENKTLGIVGMGAIGKHITKILCDGFGMNLMYTSITSKPDIDEKYNTKMVDLDTIFKNADVISINATCTDNNKGMINKSQLSLMKPNSILVNTARPELIDKSDLLDFVKHNQNIFVAMDGFYEEPLENSEDEFLKLDDVKFIITSHNAYNSIDALKEMERMLIESLEDVLNNNEIRNIIK